MKKNLKFLFSIIFCILFTSFTVRAATIVGENITTEGDLTVSGNIIAETIKDVSNQGLVGAWALNGDNVNGNTILDSSTNNLQGTIYSGGGVAPTLSDGIDGYPNGAMSFSGDSRNNIGIYNDESGLLSATTTELTVSIWIKPENFVSINSGGPEDYKILVSNKRSWINYGGGYELGINTWGDGGISFEIDNPNTSNSNYNFFPYEIINDQWINVTATFNNGIINMYIDGDLIGTKTSTTTTINYTGFITVFGSTAWSSQWYRFEGSMADIRIYHRALSEDEVNRLVYRIMKVENSYVSQKNIFVDSTGNTGIGMSTPESKLVIKGSTSDDTASAFNVLDSEGNSNFFIRNDGNVGIGTATPGAGLQVNAEAVSAPTGNDPHGSIHIVASFPYIGFEDTEATDPNDIWRLGLWNDDFLIIADDDSADTSSDLLFIQRSSGNVGIGTTEPTATLDINGYMKLNKNTSAPAVCANSNDGAIAITSTYRTCICNGGSSTWVYTSDGTTPCVWE